MAADGTSTLLDEIERQAKNGQVPAEFMADDELFAIDVERLYKNNWVYLAHESEIGEPGDYVVRNVIDEEFIVVRSEDGDVRVLENACCHQGMEVCRTNEGNTSHFRCTYHGWTYDNRGELVGVPYREQAYGDSVDRDFEGLLSAPNYDTHKGLIFVNLAEDPESLDEYIGPYSWYLDFYIGRDPDGMEVVGPQRRILDFNWKAVMVNGFGDFYHSMFTHRSASEVGAVDTTNAYGGDDNRIDPDVGYHVNAGPGGTITREGYIFDTCPESVQALHREALSEEHWEFIEKAGTPGASAMIPNTTMNSSIGVPDSGTSVPFTYMRKLRPLSPSKTEVLTWLVVEKNAPEAFKEKSRKAFVLLFGTSGLFTQDDTVNWESITKVSKGEMARRRNLRYDMGVEKGMSAMPGPGDVYDTVLTEANPRHFVKKYVEYARRE